MEIDQQMENNSDMIKVKGNKVNDSHWKKEASFLKEIYYPKTENMKVIQQDLSVADKESIKKISYILEHLGDQTDRLKSIVEDSTPAQEDDLPILQYRDYSEYIVNGFDANSKMTNIEVFTDKWERYTKERGSKETNKE